VTATTSLLTAEIDPNSVRPGWVALLIVLALGAATVLLWRSMGKQLKKIDFDGDHDGADGRAPSDGPATPDTSASPAGDAAPTDTAAVEPAAVEPAATDSAATPTQSDSKQHSQQ
jgi:hypothetical protein